MSKMTMNLDGLTVTLFRSQIDFRLCVAIESEDLNDKDTHADGVPDIRVAVNGSDSGIGPDGEWIDLNP